jgi:hypothetical protein
LQLKVEWGKLKAQTRRRARQSTFPAQLSTPTRRAAGE